MIPPILMYHRIGYQPGDGIVVSPELFEKQLLFLKENNYQTISLATWHKSTTQGKKLPDKSIILTFDDGYKDNWEQAAPLLKKYGFSATVFMVAGQIGKENNWDAVPPRRGAPLMSIEELKGWMDQGGEVGSHGMSHANITLADPTTLRYEIQKSKEILETSLEAPVDFFCYPYGFLNVNVKKELELIGYQGALAILFNAKWSNLDWFAIPRIKISERDQIFKFRWKVSPLHNFFAQTKYYTRRIKDLIED